MTTKEFLDRYDSKQGFTEDELYQLWINDLFDFDDKNVKEVEGEVWGTPDRWNTCVTRVLQIEDRYFMIYAYRGNTEREEDYYDMQPDEVYPVEKTIIVWEGIPQNV
jgi:hypothetical protein